MREMFISNANETAVASLDNESIAILHRSGISAIEADGITLTVFRMLQKSAEDGVVKTSDLQNASPIFKSQFN